MAEGRPAWQLPLPAGAARKLSFTADYAAVAPDGDRLALVKGTRISIIRWDGSAIVGVNQESHRIERRSLKADRVETIADLTGIPVVAHWGAIWMGLAPDGSPLVLRDRSTRELYALDWDAP
jgi:hypothetical protein